MRSNKTGAKSDPQVVSMLADLATLISKAMGNGSQMAMPSLILRSTKTLFRLRQILVRMSRACLSFHKAASALT